MKELNFIRKILRDMLWNLKQFRYKIEVIRDNPDSNKLKDNIVYVVGGENFSKWGYLKCPCGCGDTIMLDLNQKSFPSWSIRQDKSGRASIYPSINKLDGCKSHFFIKKGKLIWASDIDTQIYNGARNANNTYASYRNLL